MLFIVGKTLFSFQFISLMLRLEFKTKTQCTCLFISFSGVLLCSFLCKILVLLPGLIFTAVNFVVVVLSPFLLFYKWFCTNALTTSTSVF